MSKKPIVPELTDKEKLEKEIAEILAEHGGLPSNIGLKHKYWELLNELRKVMREQS
jgi:hypothetical protein